MVYVSVSVANKAAVTKLVQAIELSDMVPMFGALRSCDESLRRDFLLLVQQSSYKGKEKALAYLTSISDPINAVRTATVCLMILEGNDV